MIKEMDVELNAISLQHDWSICIAMRLLNINQLTASLAEQCSDLISKTRGGRLPLRYIT